MKKYSIVFDNKCGVCSVGVKTFKAIGLMDSQQGIELENFQKNNITCNVDPKRACDEMAVINNETLDVNYGYDGYLDLLSVNRPKIAQFFAGKRIKYFINLFYLFLASNRRVIAPIQPNETTCTPTLKKGYRFSFLLFIGIYALVITYIKGELLHDYPVFEFLSGWKLICVTGLGWLLVGVTYQKQNKWSYWGHLAMIAGSAILLQTLGLVGYYFSPSIWWILVSMGLSDLLMLVMHLKRVKVLGISQIITIRWWLILHLSAVLIIGIFKNIDL